jgi:hypothetical protein
MVAQKTFQRYITVAIKRINTENLDQSNIQ